ncbi:SigE family RNA polymerase sigma factor [Micromonospora parastrephiae]|uniref:hypothetical protein n=1 Tax=Micromonospora parastrephiae TaxID=2806101 RepID=UPI001EE45EDF|nr:hypothetical protein [Micromonospora parastrephiae]
MVYRAAIDETRRPWRRERSAGDAMPEVTVGDPAGATDERMRLRTALDTVPARQRAAVVLRHYQGLGVPRPGISCGLRRRSRRRR